MTLALGVAGPGFAVLATDSMTHRYTAAGVEGVLTAEGKLGVVEDAGLAYVHSGTVPEGWRPTVERRHTFEEMARGLFASLPVPERPAAAVLAGMREPDGSAPSAASLRRLAAQELVVVDLTARMAFLSDDGERWLPESGGIVIAGAARLWGQERRLEEQPAPLSSTAASRLAIRLGSAFIAHHYQGRTLADFAAEGILPPVAFPLHLLAIHGGGGFQTWSYQP